MYLPIWDALAQTPSSVTSAPVKPAVCTLLRDAWLTEMCPLFHVLDQKGQNLIHHVFKTAFYSRTRVPWMTEGKDIKVPGFQYTGDLNSEEKPHGIGCLKDIEGKLIMYGTWENGDLVSGAYFVPTQELISVWSFPCRFTEPTMG